MQHCWLQNNIYNRKIHKTNCVICTCCKADYCCSVSAVLTHFTGAGCSCVVSQHRAILTYNIKWATSQISCKAIYSSSAFAALIYIMVTYFNCAFPLYFFFYLNILQHICSNIGGVMKVSLCAVILHCKCASFVLQLCCNFVRAPSRTSNTLLHVQFL